MKMRYMIFAALAAFWVLLVGSVYGAVDTAGIERVRSKGVLDSKDLQIIDDFVADAVRELVEVMDFTSVSKERAVILARKSSNREEQAQYAQQFSESAYKYLSEAFEAVEKLTPEERKFKVLLNLLILVDGLEDVRLVDLAMKLLNYEDAVIRYWAVHCVTNPAIIEQLNSSGAEDLELAGNIVKQLAGLVKESGHEVIALMAKFAAEVNVLEGESLLLQIADMRIRKYAEWAVDTELLDGTILKLLADKISSGQRDNPAVARRFAQLYSYAIQRYIKGRDILSEAAKQQLASVLVETEKSCISKLLRMPQSVIKGAIERDSITGLLQEHNRLLGDETRIGQLALELNFDYGKTADGSKRIAPLVLPDKP